MTLVHDKGAVSAFDEEVLRGSGQLAIEQVDEGAEEGHLVDAGASIIRGLIMK